MGRNLDCHFNQHWVQRRVDYGWQFPRPAPQHQVRLSLKTNNLARRARAVVQLTLACKVAPKPGTDAGRALRHLERRGKVRPELLRRDSWLLPTNKRDKNKGKVGFGRGEPRVLRDNEDLDLGTAISVTQRW